MTRRATPLPHGWWIIPGALLCTGAWFGAAYRMASMTAWAQSWGAMP